MSLPLKMQIINSVSIYNNYFVQDNCKSSKNPLMEIIALCSYRVYYASFLICFCFVSEISGQCSINFGSASEFALFTISGAVSNTGVTGIIGDVGTNTGAISGFETPSSIAGTIYNSDAITTSASTDLITAYTELFNTIPTNASHAPAFGNGETLAASVYSIGGAGSVAGTLILDGEGNPNSVFIFKIGGALTTGAGTTINLINGAQAGNVYWVANGAISMATNTIINGTMIANGAVAMGAGGIIHGRLYSIVGAISVYATKIDRIGINVGESIGGMVSSNQTICLNTKPIDLVLTGYTGNIINWQKSSESDFISPKDISCTLTTLSGDSIGNLIETTYFRALVKTNGCGATLAFSTFATVSIVSTSWNGSEWSNGEPTDSTKVVLAANYISNGSFSACSLLVSNNAKVIIDAGDTITLNGALTVANGSSFTLESDSNLVQKGGTTNPNMGSIQVKRNSSSLYLLDYTLWSSPVENQNLYSFSPRTLANRFYEYDTPTNQYSPVASNNNFKVAKGYLIRAPKDYSSTTPAIYIGAFSGKPNSGTITFPMSIAETGFNAVGNPYPSQINVHGFLEVNTNISGILYFWRKRNDQYATSYATLTRDDYAANTATGGDTGSTYFNGTASANWVLNVGQGFLVQATSATNLVFTNIMRRGENNANQFFRTSNKTTSTASKYKLNLSSTNGFFSQMALSYASDYTLGVDKGVDAFNINSNYLSSSIEGLPYVIQGRPEFTVSDVVPLVYKIPVADEYTISIDLLVGVFAGQDVFIKDKWTNVIHNLKTGPYTFASESGIFTDRFEVVYERLLSTSASKFNKNSVLVYKQNQDVVINTGTVQMSNVKSMIFEDVYWHQKAISMPHNLKCMQELPNRY